VRIPKYNNENRWYIEKYQSIVRLFESAAPDSAFVPPQPAFVNGGDGSVPLRTNGMLASPSSANRPK